MRVPRLVLQLLGPMAVVALVKCFDLEWSLELVYLMYHDSLLEMHIS